jgi:hypothetical protein
MAADLATLPTSGLRTQISGDAHVQNLGAYAAPDGHLVFDLNDFDETIDLPWPAHPDLSFWQRQRPAGSLPPAGRLAIARRPAGVLSIRAQDQNTTPADGGSRAASRQAAKSASPSCRSPG